LQQARPAALDRLLSRSRRVSTGGGELESQLCSLFGLERESGYSLPVAPLTRLADTGKADAGYVMRADPVHLRADQSCLRLFEAHSFRVSQDEASQLTAAINELYVDSGWRLEPIRPQRWYLSLPQAPAITTFPLARVAGQDIDPCLPQGAAATEWHRLLNEIQMLLHSHPVNAARERRGEPVINSLWFWGGGLLPQDVHATISQHITDHALGIGLAMLADIPRRGLPAEANDLLTISLPGVNLVVNDVLQWPAQYGDVEHWLDCLQQLEEGWFSPLLTALRRGELASLTVYPCNKRRFTSSRAQQRCFWKTVQPFETECRL
jgi:hypothetical protein